MNLFEEQLTLEIKTTLHNFVLLIESRLIKPEVGVLYQ